MFVNDNYALLRQEIERPGRQGNVLYFWQTIEPFLGCVAPKGTAGCIMLGQEVEIFLRKQGVIHDTRA